jgi:hypothetical protein
VPTAVRKTEGDYAPGSQLYHNYKLRTDPSYQLPADSGWTQMTDRRGLPMAGHEGIGFTDWFYKNFPTMLAAAGTAGIATTPALAGASLATKAGANAALQAGLKAGSGGSLKDVALAGASGAAGAGTGGGSMSWVDLLKDPNTYAAIAQVAGQAAGGKSDQRMQQSQVTNQSNLSDLALYSAAQNAQNQAGQLDLNRKSFSEDARGGRAKQALLADLLSNIKDVNISVPGVQNANVSGGLRPSAIGSTGQSSLAELAKQALQAQLAGDEFTGGKILPTPEYKPMPERGGVESTLDWIGLLGSGAGALGAIMNKPGTYSQLPGQTGVRPQGLRY